MKSMILAAAFALMMLAMVRGADDPARTELAEELLTIMRCESTFRSGWTSYPPVAGAGDQVDAAEVSRALWLKLKPDYVKAYAEVYSAEELRGLVAFFKSPIGQAYLDKTPELTRKLMSVHGIPEPGPSKSN